MSNKKLIPSCLVAFVLLLVLSGCGTRSGIADLDRLRQDANAYLDAETAYAPLVPAKGQRLLAEQYRERFFRPWHMKRASLSKEDAFWAVRVYGDKTGYAENLQRWSMADWDRLVASQRMGTYPSLAEPAVMVRNTAMRVFPTQRPFFYDPAQAGEGFPFDYFQNSAIWSGTPVLVTHTSADGAWYYVESGFAYGWVPVTAVAFAGAEFRTTYETGAYAAVVRDSLVLRDADDRYLATAHIGCIFPVSRLTQQGPEIFVPVRDADGNAVMVQSLPPEKTTVAFPHPLSARRVAYVANRMLGQPYGWGGMFENRDCSASMRDLFTPFGVWLPRNSSQQGQHVGTSISLDGKTAIEKRRVILEQGVPYYSLIWLRGHIGLYLGKDEQTGDPLMLHNVWGLRSFSNGREQRVIVGRMVVTTLSVGEERYDVADNWLYNRVKGLVILPDGSNKGIQ